MYQNILFQTTSYSFGILLINALSLLKESVSVLPSCILIGNHILFEWIKTIVDFNLHIDL